MTTSGSVMNSDDLRRCIDSLPRARLAHLPTPLDEISRFSDHFGGPRILIKRDDCTGLALGGNKTRHSEFVMGEAFAEGTDLVVWGAGVQSNNCRQTAAACASLGLDCHLVLSRSAGHEEVQGNLLLDYLLGATYEIVDATFGPELDAAISETADRFRSQGRNVYHATRDSVRTLSAVSYTLCMVELVEQLSERNIDPAAVYVSSGGATGAGLALGKALLGASFRVRSILPAPGTTGDDRQYLASIANDVARLLHFTVRLESDDIDVDADHIGPGYSIPSPACMEAIALLARTEGILLEPSYSGKAMGALIADIRAGHYSSDQTLLFLHTGGTPALFAYRDELLDMIPGVNND